MYKSPMDSIFDYKVMLCGKTFDVDSNNTRFFIYKNNFIRTPASDLNPKNNSSFGTKNLRTISGSNKLYWFL